MKKIFLMAVAAIMAISASAQDTVKKVRVYKEGTIAYEEKYNVVDSIVFVDVEVPVPGTLSGKFSVSADKQVRFSQGNLQYVGTWQFAENQWDIFGYSQSDNHRDLFGWGTGDAPNKVSTSGSDYTNFTDWGENPITNGGNEADVWHTLTRDEWVYLIDTRDNASSLRARATVHSVAGLIILPDGYTGAIILNTTAANYTTNTISDSDWTTLESDGAVFLPAAGDRNGTGVVDVSSGGFYWSVTLYDTNAAYFLKFGSSYLDPQYPNSRKYGLSVRLVR